MSEANRKREYERLIALNRQKDIPQSLIDEFRNVPTKPEKPVKKKVKTNGR